MSAFFRFASTLNGFTRYKASQLDPESYDAPDKFWDYLTTADDLMDLEPGNQLSCAFYEIGRADFDDKAEEFFPSEATIAEAFFREIFEIQLAKLNGYSYFGYKEYQQFEYYKEREGTAERESRERGKELLKKAKEALSAAPKRKAKAAA